MTDSSPRVLLFGASGYTGRLTALAMARRGLRPVLVGRSRSKLEAVVGEILSAKSVAGGLEIADVTDPSSLAAVVRAGDVLVSTVGPFVTMGEPAITTAINKGALAYIDSTGEPPFIRRVFEEWGPQADRAGVALVTAFGYDYVPGNLAAALAFRQAVDAGVSPVRVDVGYFVKGTMSMSGGTAASAAGALTMPHFEFTRAHLSTVRGGNSWRSFDIDGTQWDGLSVGATEHFTVPRLSPTITEVNTYLGWAGKNTRHVSRLSGATSLVAKIPGFDRALGALSSRTAPAPGDGPSEETRSQARTLAVAETFDGVGRQLSRVVVEGPSPYDLTAELLAWAADESLAGHLTRTGALGPADAFGGPGATVAASIEAFAAGCASLDLSPTAT
ncbi:MAG: saccharopine dehydrogenase NADP-binding domain-containing protein, partial [Actinomycetes bacterium]